MTKHITISTTKGSTTFTTELEWDEALVLCSSVKNSDFAQSLVDQFNQNRKPLSPKQISWVYKFAEDAKAQSSRVIETPVRKAQVFVNNILSSMAQASANGLKKPQVRLVGPDKLKVKIVYMAAGTNAGGCWINISSSDMFGYILGGQITATGELRIFSREVCDKQVLADYFTAVDNNFEIAVKDYGYLMSSCSICGLPLTDPKSIERGIGPVCAGKYGMGL
jgi:hypothetical protein